MNETTIKQFVKDKIEAKEVLFYDSYVIEYWHDKKRGEYHLVLHNFPNTMIRESPYFLYRLPNKDNIHIVVRGDTPISYE